jgi:hypothetical protein
MSLEKIYAALAKNNLQDGIVYVTTQDNRLLEVYVFGGIIINVRSNSLSVVDAINTILEGAVKDVKAGGPVAKANNIQPFVVKKLLPLTTPYIFSPQKPKLPAIVRALKLMGHTAKSDIGEIRDLTNVIALEISKINPKLNIDKVTIQNRIRKLKETYGMEMLGLASDFMPAGDKETLAWIFDYVNLGESNALLDNIMYFIFFGEFSEQPITAKIKKDEGFGAKSGFVRLSKVIYQRFSDNSSATIFYQNKQKAALGINWITEKKPDILFTNPDMERLGLNEGAVITLIPAR